MQILAEHIFVAVGMISKIAGHIPHAAQTYRNRRFDCKPAIPHRYARIFHGNLHARNLILKTFRIRNVLLYMGFRP